MSENIPESIPTSADPRSNRPLKRRALSPTSKQAADLTHLFAHPDRQIPDPSSSKHLSRTSAGAAPPEIVANVQGSSAGAGSGEFHVYKASRRREYERLRVMDEETERERADAEFEARQEGVKSRDDEKTAKNRAKREKARMRQVKKKGGAAGGAAVDAGAAEGDKMGEGVQKAKFKPNVPASGNEKEGANVESEVQNPEELGIVIHDED